MFTNNRMLEVPWKVSWNSPKRCLVYVTVGSGAIYNSQDIVQKQRKCSVIQSREAIIRPITPLVFSRDTYSNTGNTHETHLKSTSRWWMVVLTDLITSFRQYHHCWRDENHSSISEEDLNWHARIVSAPWCLGHRELKWQEQTSEVDVALSVQQALLPQIDQP